MRFLQVLARPRPVRTLLLFMALAIMLPALAFSAYLVAHLAGLQREQFKDRLSRQAANLANDLDRDTERLLTLLDTLAVSRSLKSHDFEAFHAEASLAVARAGTFIAVSESSGQQLVNTRVPFGAALPKPPIPDEQRATLASGKPYIGNVTLGMISHKWVFGIAIPLKLDGYPGAMMTMIVDADHLLPLMDGLFLPSNWLTGISDRQSRVVARSRDQQNYVGTLLPEGLRPSGHSNRDVFEATSLDGVVTLRSVAQTKYAGWDVTAIVPKSLIDAEIRGAELGLALGGLALLALASALAGLFARWIIEPVQSLASAAAKLESGKLTKVETSPVAEVNDVAASLREAAQELATRGATLFRNERRFALAQKTAGLAYYELDLHRQTMSVSSNFSDIFGFQPADDTPLSTVHTELHRIHPDDRERVRLRQQTGMQTPGQIEDEYRILMPDGSIRWIAAHIETIADRNGRPSRMIGANLDITRRKEQETHITFMMREVSHRAKNLLAIIQAMATQTARTSVSITEFQARFSQRLQGLSASHDLLVNQNWEGVDLAALIWAQLKPFADDAGGRLTVAGPAIFLTPASAQSLGLALHELATNATKYGALSIPNGTVTISWRLAAEMPDPKFYLTWTESGGPQIGKPKHKGFGHTVYERMMGQALNASVHTKYEPTGIVWTIEAALSSVGHRS